MNLKAVFCDLDGTLLDTSVDLGCALNHVLKNHGLPILAQDKIRPYVSNGASALIKMALGEDVEPALLDEYRTQLLDYYLNNIAAHTTAFPGIQELIEECTSNNILWGVVTNKPSIYTEALMSHFKFASPPCSIVCPDHLGISKPRPEPLLHACKVAGCLPHEAIYVGDHSRDIECGLNANMPTIAVGYGFTTQPNEHLDWSATHAVSHASEIWPILKNHLHLTMS